MPGFCWRDIGHKAPMPYVISDPEVRSSTKPAAEAEELGKEVSDARSAPADADARERDDERVVGLSMSLGMIENNSQRRFSRGGSQKTPNGADTRGLAVL